MVNGGLTNYLSYKDMDLNNKTLEELVEYFKTLNKGSDFRDAWNSLEQEKCEAFYDYLKSIPATKKSYSNLGAEYMATLHKQFKSDFWTNEIELIKQGKGTRNWTVDEQAEMLKNGYIKGYEIQHMCSKSKYPHLACTVSNGQALKFSEHCAKGSGIHSIMGGTHITIHGYVNEYDFPNLKLYDFSSKDIDNGFPPVTNLTELCDEVKELGLYNSKCSVWVINIIALKNYNWKKCKKSFAL